MMNVPKPTPEDYQRIEQAIRNLDDYIRLDEGYAWYRYTIMSSIFRRVHGSNVVMPPFPGTASFAETMEKLPYKLFEHIEEQIILDRERLHSDDLPKQRYDQCVSLLQDLVPEAALQIPPYEELLARSYFGHYRRNGLS
ncbi:MAG: hypothetical protein PHN92_07895 [Geobacter sp.]|nr:hypothetical protein [Geobacter sp.]